MKDTEGMGLENSTNEVYRMNTFKDIIGHKDVVSYIEHATEMGNVSHAYIISGEKGAGKKMLADLFARKLLCDSEGSDPCNQCKSCIQAEGHNNPDIIHVIHEKPSSIGVEDVRSQVNKDVYIKPYAGKYKVYIIPEAEKLTEQAQNAILKTIEEPPEYVIILLLTENVGALLPTIQSRCIMLKLRNIKDELVKNYLMTNIEIPDYEASLCAAFAQGNIGKAVTLATSEHFREIKEEAMWVLSHINRLEVDELIDCVKRIAAYKLEINDFLDILTAWYRDVLVYKATRNMEKLIFKEDLDDVQERAMKSSYRGIEIIIESIEKAKTRLKANVNFELTMELMLLSIKEN